MIDPLDSPLLAETSDPVSVLPDPSVAITLTVSPASSVPLKVASTTYDPEFERLTRLLLAHTSVLPVPFTTVAPTHIIGCNIDTNITKVMRKEKILYLSFWEKFIFAICFIRENFRI